MVGTIGMVMAGDHQAAHSTTNRYSHEIAYFAADPYPHKGANACTHSSAYSSK